MTTERQAVLDYADERDEAVAALNEAERFAQGETEEPSVMHVSDMARLMRDYVDALLRRVGGESNE